MKQGNYAASLRHLENLQPVVKQLDDLELQVAKLSKLAEINSKLQNHKAAFEQLMEYQKLSDSLVQLANNNLVREMQTKYKSEKKELENSQLRIKN